MYGKMIKDLRPFTKDHFICGKRIKDLHPLTILCIRKMVYAGTYRYFVFHDTYEKGIKDFNAGTYRYYSF